MKDKARRNLLTEARRLRAQAQHLLNRAETLEAKANAEPVEVVIKKTTVQMWLHEPHELIELYGSETFSGHSRAQFHRSLEKMPKGINFSQEEREEFIIKVLLCIEEKVDKEPYRDLLVRIALTTGLTLT
ncbi:MAG: hypothetical protein ACRCYY_16030 [Trueperaceae bacterium]